jgi:hypothetical protein
LVNKHLNLLLYFLAWKSMLEKNFSLLFWFFETESYSVLQAGLKLSILLLPSSECWAYRHVLPHPARKKSFEILVLCTVSMEAQYHMGNKFPRLKLSISWEIQMPLGRMLLRAPEASRNYIPFLLGMSKEDPSDSPAYQFLGLGYTLAQSGN